MIISFMVCKYLNFENTFLLVDNFIGFVKGVQAIARNTNISLSIERLQLSPFVAGEIYIW